MCGLIGDNVMGVVSPSGESIAGLGFFFTCACIHTGMHHIPMSKVMLHHIILHCKRLFISRTVKIGKVLI